MSLEDLLKRVDEAGFTPGPWHVRDLRASEMKRLCWDGEFIDRILISNKDGAGIIECEGQDCIIARISFDNRPTDEALGPSNLADARLIAAAPAMFEALKPFAMMADWLPEDGRVARIRISDDIDFEITGKDLHRAKEALLRALISQKEGVE